MTPALPDPTDLEKFITAIVDFATAKDYVALLALGVSAFVFALKRYGGKLPKIGGAINAFLATDQGSILLVFTGAFAGALFFGPHVLAGGTFVAATKAAFYAMGGFAVVYKLLLPLVQVIVGKLFPSDGQAAAADVATKATATGAAANTSDAAVAAAANKLIERK